MSEKSAASPLTGSSAVLALFALLGGAAVVGTRPKDSPTAPPLPTTAPADQNRPPPTDDPDPLVVLDEYFDYRSKDGTADLPAGGHTAALDLLGLRLHVHPRHQPPKKAKLRLPDRAINYEFLICSVPDPVDSKFAVYFDAAVDAVGRAFQARRFVLQASWLPWKPEAVGKPPSDDLHRKVPGVLLFRKVVPEKDEPATATGTKATDLEWDRTPGVAVVCLVGENPVSGLHSRALATALDCGRRLRDAVGRHEQSAMWPRDMTFRLVAPYYSGSQGAVKDTVSAWAAADATPHKQVFRLVSGTASGVNVERYFPPARPGRETQAELTFAATVAPSNLLEAAVCDYLRAEPVRELSRIEPPKWDELGKVAFLRESNTGYGAAVHDMKYANRLHPKHAPLDLPFPASVSQIQADLEKLVSPAGPAMTLPPDFATPPLPVRNVASGRDGVPLFDRDSSVALAAEMLRNTLATIHRERVRYVGIVATDDRDTVFLDRLLHRHCPGVRTFCTEASQVLCRPDESYHMRGTVVASTYPLYLANQGWTRSRERTPFLTNAAQGLYNAVLAQSGQDDLMLEYRPPRIDRHDGAVAGGGTKPPIWVSVVGSNGEAVPVRVYREYNDEGYTYEAQAPEQPAVGGPARQVPRPHRAELSPAPPIGLLVLVLVTFVVTAMAAVTCLTDWWRRTILFDPAERPRAASNTGRALCWLSGLLLIAPQVPLVAALGFTAPANVWGPFSSWHVVGVVVLLTVGVAMFGTALTYSPRLRRAVGRVPWVGRRLAHRRAEFRPPVTPKGEALVVGLIGLLSVAGLVFCAVGWSTPDARFLWLVRAADLASGLSPLLPTTLLGAAAGVFGLMRVKQSRLLTVFRVRRPFPVTTRFAGVLRGHEELFADCYSSAMLRKPSDNPTGCLALGAALAFVGWYVVAAHRTLESRAWEGLVAVGFVVVFLTMTLGLIRFLTVWRRLKALAREVCRLPMAEAFERLPDPVVRAVHACQFSDHPRPAHLAVARQEWNATFPDEQLEAGPGEYGFNRDARRLVSLARARLVGLDERWQKRDVTAAFGRSEPPKPRHEREEEAAQKVIKAGKARSAPLPPAPTGEDFAAVVIAVYLCQYFVQLRLTAWSLTVAGPLLLLAAASYPFEPERPLVAAVGVLIGLTVAAIVYVLVDMNRNELLSRIGRTAPGRFTPDRGFLESVLKFAGPLLLAVSLQASGLLRVVLDPLLGLSR